jgi:hypothetical protein
MTRLVDIPNDKPVSFLTTNGLGKIFLFVLRILQNKTRSVWQNEGLIYVKVDMAQTHSPKRKQLGLQLHRMYWIIGRKSKLSLENKLLIYKTILKPIWTYGIPLWGTASNSNIEILQRFQNKVLRLIVNATWYVPNTILHTDLQIPTFKVEITNFSTKYREKLITHPNELIPALLEEEEPRRLKRFKPSELTKRFS